MQLGINGRSEKLTLLKSLKELVADAVKNGADTIVAVGNDDTVSKMISIIPSLNVTFGIIPVGQPNSIASILGIPSGVAACDVLSARIIEKIDLGKANDSYFISSLTIPTNKSVIINCGKYNISPLASTSHVNVYNINSGNHHSNPKDGKLEVVLTSEPTPVGILGKLKKQYSTDSIFPIKKITITCDDKSLSVLADGQTTIKTPVTVEVVPKELKVVVGKDRMF